MMGSGGSCCSGKSSVAIVPMAIHGYDVTVKSKEKSEGSCWPKLRRNNGKVRHVDLANSTATHTKDTHWLTNQSESVDVNITTQRHIHKNIRIRGSASSVRTQHDSRTNSTHNLVCVTGGSKQNSSYITNWSTVISSEEPPKRDDETGAIFVPVVVGILDSDNVNPNGDKNVNTNVETNRLNHKFVEKGAPLATTPSVASASTETTSDVKHKGQARDHEDTAGTGRISEVDRPDTLQENHPSLSANEALINSLLQRIKDVEHQLVAYVMHRSNTSNLNSGQEQDTILSDIAAMIGNLLHIQMQMEQAKMTTENRPVQSLNMPSDVEITSFARQVYDDANGALSKEHVQKQITLFRKNWTLSKHVDKPVESETESDQLQPEVESESSSEEEDDMSVIPQSGSVHLDYSKHLDNSFEENVYASTTSESGRSVEDEQDVRLVSEALTNTLLHDLENNFGEMSEKRFQELLSIYRQERRDLILSHGAESEGAQHSLLARLDEKKHGKDKMTDTETSMTTDAMVDELINHTFASDTTGQETEISALEDMDAILNEDTEKVKEILQRHQLVQFDVNDVNNDEREYMSVRGIIAQDNLLQKDLNSLKDDLSEKARPDQGSSSIDDVRNMLQEYREKQSQLILIKIENDKKINNKMKQMLIKRLQKRTKRVRDADEKFLEDNFTDTAATLDGEELGYILEEHLDKVEEEENHKEEEEHQHYEKYNKKQTTFTQSEKIVTSESESFAYAEASCRIQEEYADKLQVEVRLLHGAGSEEIQNQVRAIIASHQMAHTKLQQRILLTKAGQSEQLMAKLAYRMEERKQSLIERTEELMSEVEDEIWSGSEVKELEDKLQSHLLEVKEMYQQDWNYYTQNDSSSRDEEDSNARNTLNTIISETMETNPVLVEELQDLENNVSALLANNKEDLDKDKLAVIMTQYKENQAKLLRKRVTEACKIDTKLMSKLRGRITTLRDKPDSHSGSEISLLTLHPPSDDEAEAYQQLDLDLYQKLDQQRMRGNVTSEDMYHLLDEYQGALLQQEMLQHRRRQPVSGARQRRKENNEQETQRRLEAKKLLQEHDEAARLASQIREKEKVAVGEKLTEKLNQRRKSSVHIATERYEEI